MIGTKDSTHPCDINWLVGSILTPCKAGLRSLESMSQDRSFSTLFYYTLQTSPKEGGHPVGDRQVADWGYLRGEHDGPIETSKHPDSSK